MGGGMYNRRDGYPSVASILPLVRTVRICKAHRLLRTYEQGSREQAKNVVLDGESVLWEKRSWVSMAVFT